MFTPPPLRKKPEGPKNFREFWQSLKDAFRRLLYIYQLVWDARPSVILLMALFSLFNGVLPVISTYISKMILDIFVQASGQEWQNWIGVVVGLLVASAVFSFCQNLV